VLNYALIFSPRSSVLRFLLSFSPVFSFACFWLVSTVLPAQAYAQNIELPPYDSFSYLKDPLFNPPRPNPARPNLPRPQSPEQGAATAEQNKPVEAVSKDCPVVETARCENGLDEFETRLAIDKALSQILKLTVDYGALRNRVSGLAQQSSDQSVNGFNLDSRVEAMQALNLKQIADRDEQIDLLQTRLMAVQKRYDNENVARLLAEKRLKVARDGVKKNNASVAKTNRKVQKLAEQLAQSQATIRQLKIDLTDAKLELHRQNSAAPATEVKAGVESNAVPEPTAASPAGATVGQASGLATIMPASEWVIDGLEFEEGSAEIKLASAANLGKLAAYLISKPALHVQINGYTDSIGSAASNLKLSQARAQAVADYLKRKGANPYQIKVLGYGERRPLGDNMIEAGRKKNRRVAVIFLN